jgi:hypothetical protein
MQFRDRVEEIEKYAADKFSLGPDGLVPDVKRRTVTRMFVEAVTVSELIKECKTGQARKATSSNCTLIGQELM